MIDVFAVLGIILSVVFIAFFIYKFYSYLTSKASLKRVSKLADEFRSKDADRYREIWELRERIEKLEEEISIEGGE